MDENEPVEDAEVAARSLAEALLNAGKSPSVVIKRVNAAYGLPEIAQAVIVERAS